MYVTHKNKYHKRLYEEWIQFGKAIIAVDFDDTISPWKFKDADDLIQFDKTINLLKICKQTGAYVTIFTACNQDRYEEIKSYCASKGLEIDSINQTPVDNIPYGKNGKIYANVFLDDRAGILETIEMLEECVYRVRAFQQSQIERHDGA
jgi:hypothetical protein